MSIEQAFDNKSEPLITPEKIYGTHEKIADICIVTFSHAVHDRVVKEYKCSKIAYPGTANGRIPIYKIKDENILFYMSPIGSASAGCILDEARCLTGATKFIVFGSCGVLDKERCDGKIIVPTAAYRDEGFSYHFMPKSDYVEIQNSTTLLKILEELQIDCVAGKTWTTDAFYMETVNKSQARKNEGCICVDMECAGLQALCNFRKIELYPFFFGGDLLNDASWDRNNLGTDNEKAIQLSCFDIALRLARKLENQAV